MDRPASKALRRKRTQDLDPARFAPPPQFFQARSGGDIRRVQRLDFVGERGGALVTGGDVILDGTALTLWYPSGKIAV